MAINFPSDLEITNNNYPLIKSIHQSIQGFMLVDNDAARDAININKRALSAFVIVEENSKPYVYRGVTINDVDWLDAANWKDLTPPPAPDEGIQLGDLDATTVAPNGLGTLTYNDTTGLFTLTPTDISGKADQTALNAVISDVADNDAAIATNAGLIATNTSDIGDLEASQLVQDGLIAGNTSAIGGKVDQGDFDTLETQVTTNTADILSAVGSISGNATDISNLEASQATQDGKITTLETEMDTAEGRLDAIETEQSTQNNAIASNTTNIAGKVGDILEGANVTVSQAGDVYTISADAAADPETTFSYTTTDTQGGIPAGTTISIGTPLEDLIRDMLVSYQNLVLSIGTSIPTLEHDASFSQNDYTLNRTNPGSGDTSANSGTAVFNDEFGTNDLNVNYTPNGLSSQSITVGVSFTPVVSPTATAGQDGQPKNNNSGNYIEFSEDNTQSATRTTRRDYKVWFKSYFGTSTLNVNAGNLATIFPSLLSNMQDANLTSDSYGSYNAPPNSQESLSDSYMYFICPECHITAGDYIITDGSFDITTAWDVLGEVVHNGCAYRVLVSDTPAAYEANQLITLEPKP